MAANLKTAVVAAGGWAHPGDDLVAAVVDLLEPRDFAVQVTRDAASFEAALSTCDLLVVGACWFAMTDTRYSHDQRAEHAVEASPELLDGLRRLRAAGCPVLALHTAVICFDGHPVWRDWLGGTWNWETSFHPPPESMEIHPAEGHRGFESFSVVDEHYQGLDVVGDVEVIAESTAGEPLVWLHAGTAGRAAVNVLGHDRRSLANADHVALNEQLLDWLLRAG